MVKVKFTKCTLVEGIRYGAGGIDVVSEGDALYLYGLGDAVPHSDNVVRKKFGLSKMNNFLNVHGKKI